MIGIDFDNTIACYDAVFHAEAVARGLVPESLPLHKTAVRDHLRESGRTDVWTALQGEVYGRCMDRVEPFPGVLETFAACRREGLDIAIVSHKTKHPVLGPPLDLHAAALGWLTRWGFFQTAEFGLSPERVFWEPTREQKLQRITALGCTRFVDDLPELFADADFPAGVEPLLFDPGNLYQAPAGGQRAASWAALAELLGVDHAR